MKLVVMMFLALFFIAACNNADDVVSIDEGSFINQISNITFNRGEYLGRTLSLEGIFKAFPREGAEPLHQVFRYIPGCCGPDSTVGFALDMGDFEPLPDYAWAKVSGILDEYNDPGGFTRLHLIVTSLTESEETRGAEFLEP